MTNYSNISNEIFTFISEHLLAITILFGIVGIVSLVIGTSESVKTRKNKKMSERREHLKNLIKPPGPSFTFSDLYKFLYKHHSGDIKKNKEYRMVDYDYFKENLSGFEFSEDIDFYKFPILFKEKWLRSYNKSMTIELNQALRERCENGSLFVKGQKFLSSFNICNYFEFLKKDCEKDIWPGKTFDLYKFEEKGDTLELTFCMGNYSRFVQTYDLLQKELLYNYSNGHKKYDLRGEIDFGNITDYSKRPAKTGIVVFTIMKRGDGKYSIFIHERKDAQLENSRFTSVLPAGAFQPQGDAKRTEQFKFGYTIFREFLEEIFNMEEVDKEYRLTDPMKIFLLPTSHASDIDVNPSITPGKLLLNFNQNGEPDLDLFETKKYTLIPTGFMIDITSFKPELTFLLYIKDINFYNITHDYIEASWEGTIAEYDLTGDELSGNFREFVIKSLNNNSFCPASTVSIIEGLKWFSENIMEDSD